MKNILIILLVFLGGVGVLLISMSRASLEIIAKDEREGTLRVEPVFIGDKMIYKLPQTNMLPDDLLYGFKEIRDWFWQQFSMGKEKEAEIMFILADKKIAEVRIFVKKGRYDLALESGIEAVDKLKYADELVGEMENQKTVQQQMGIQIKDAAIAYSEIIKEIGQKSGNYNQEYLLLQKNIDDFKEGQIKKEKDQSS